MQLQQTWHGRVIQPSKARTNKDEALCTIWFINHRGAIYLHPFQHTVCKNSGTYVLFLIMIVISKGWYGIQYRLHVTTSTYICM